VTASKAGQTKAVKEMTVKIAKQLLKNRIFYLPKSMSLSENEQTAEHPSASQISRQPGKCQLFYYVESGMQAQHKHTPQVLLGRRRHASATGFTQ
jgi:hypothetical protein